MGLLRAEHICQTYGSGEAAAGDWEDNNFSVSKGNFVAWWRKH